MSKIILDIRDDIAPTNALHYAMIVAEGGKVSGPPDNRQHCYHSVFKNGVTVSVFKRRGSSTERFVISAK